MTKLIGYARVSTRPQSTERQQADLLAAEGDHRHDALRERAERSCPQPRLRGSTPTSSGRPRPRARNQSILERHVMPRWGDLQVSQVQPEDVQKWVAELSRSGLAPRSVRKV